MKRKVEIVNHSDINNLILILLLLPLAIGILLGLQEKIVVYRNYDDLCIVFAAAVLPLPFLLLYSITTNQIIIYAFIFTELALIFWIIYRSYMDNNGNIFSTFLSLYTKIPLSILFIFKLFSLLEYFSKSEQKREGGFSFIPLIILTPLILKLIKHKNGVINCKRIQNI